MASEELIKRHEKTVAFLRKFCPVPGHRYEHNFGCHEPDHYDVVPTDMGHLSSLMRHNEDDDYMLVLGFTGLTDVQVDAILTIVAATKASEKII